MKAWVVFYGEQWCVLLHADTRGKAQALAMGLDHGDNDFVRYRAIRLPGLDDKPITFDNAHEAGFHYYDDYDDGIPIEPEDFFNDCRCELCKPL